jgi:Fe-Mn family superoxide dismutase
MSLELPNLPYAYDALAPYMSPKTLELHHDKHHMAYVTNGNLLLDESDFKAKSLEDIMARSIIVKSYQHYLTMWLNIGIILNFGNR